MWQNCDIEKEHLQKEFRRLVFNKTSWGVTATKHPEFEKAVRENADEILKKTMDVIRKDDFKYGKTAVFEFTDDKKYKVKDQCEIYGHVMNDIFLQCHTPLYTTCSWGSEKAILKIKYRE